MSRSLSEESKWEPTIYQLEKETPVLAGPGGPDNIQAQQLANRTAWLKLQVESASDYREYTFFKTESDPDGTITGLANTPSGKIFRVAEGIGSSLSFTYYLNDAGVALTISSMPGMGAITNNVRFYTTLPEAQNDVLAGNILNDSKCWVMDGELADEYINNGGTLEATGRQMPSKEAINSIAEKESSGGITRITTPDNNVTLLQDELGKLFLPGMEHSVQDTLQPIKQDPLPVIRRWNDCRGRSVEIIDELGEVHIPGMPSSIQRSFSQIARRVSYLEGKQVFIDAREFGFGRKNNMPLDNNRALQAAINFAANKPAGGTVFLPYDTVSKRGSITPKNNVSIIGYGMGKSVILQEGSESAFLLYQSGIYLDNCLFADFTIDGQQQTLPSTGYTPSVKGLYFQFFKRCFFHRLEITNTAATGMGIDYALDSSITDCIVNGCGRLATVGQPGASGIGIGTGGAQDEPLYISGNFCDNNRNFGIFVEKQQRDDSPYISYRTIITGNNCRGNHAGIADCGVSGAIITSNQLTGNEYGFLLDGGTLPTVNNSPLPGADGLFANNQVNRNTRAGIRYDNTKAQGNGGYSMNGNGIRDNVGAAVELLSGSNRIPGISLCANEMERNEGPAVWVRDGAVDSLIINNNPIQNNAGAAVQIDGVVNVGRIFGNSVYNSTGTTQGGLSGGGAVTDVDISENHFVGIANALNLTGVLTRVTYGRNPGA